MLSQYLTLAGKCAHNSDHTDDKYDGTFSVKLQKCALKAVKRKIQILDDNV